MFGGPLPSVLSISSKAGQDSSLGLGCSAPLPRGSKLRMCQNHGWLENCRFLGLLLI